MTNSHTVLADAGTAVISDVFDALGQTPLALDNRIVPVNFANRAFAGVAYTVEGEQHRWTGGGDRNKLAAIDGMTPGVIAVWAGNDVEGVCCFGDLLSTAMQARGCAGVVVDGGVRDVAFLRTLDLPISARYRTPAQAIGRWRVTSRQTPVKVRGALQEWITVHPGDVIVVDDDGSVVVPQEQLDEVTRRVAEWSRSETHARQEIAQGLRLLEAIEKYGHL